LLRTIIHIGQHKTGTKSIQAYLRHNKTKLAEKGLYVPESIAGYAYPSHYILNVYALDENRLSSMKQILLKTKPKEYFLRLSNELKRDIDKHYLVAEAQRCKDVIWTNEGLYLLNTVEEYKRLRDLFDKNSSSVVCVCCFRDVHSYRASYIKQLAKQGISLSTDKDSYRYVESDSWLFDYSRKVAILKEVFDEVVTFPYDRVDNVRAFMKQIGYFDDNIGSIRLNVTKDT